MNARFGAFGRHLHDLARRAGAPLADQVRGEQLTSNRSRCPDDPRRHPRLARQLGKSVGQGADRAGLHPDHDRTDAAAGQSRPGPADRGHGRTRSRPLRWQAEGWLAGVSAGAGRPGTNRTGTAQADPQALDIVDEPAPDAEDFSEDGIIALRLIAAELTTPIGATRSLFDENTGQITYTLERLQGLFGPDAVLVPGIQGGWDPAETNLWTPWQQAAAPERSPAAPWPGALHAPRPTTVEHSAVDVLAADGSPVEARPSGLGAAPATIRFPTGQTRPSPTLRFWPMNPDGGTRADRLLTCLQVVTDTGRFPLSKERGQWYLTGRYR